MRAERLQGCQRALSGDGNHRPLLSYDMPSLFAGPSAPRPDGAQAPHLVLPAITPSAFLQIPKAKPSQ